MNVKLDTTDLEALAELLSEKIAARLADKLAAAPPTDNKLLFREPEVAEMLGVSHFTLRDWREKGCFNASTNTRPILYDREAIAAVKAFMKRR